MAPQEERREWQKVQTDMIHPGLRANFVIRLKALGVQVTTLSTADVFDELGAQLNLTEKPK